MARAFGRMPHEILRLAPDEVALAEAVLDAMDRATAEACAEAQPMAVVDLRQ